MRRGCGRLAGQRHVVTTCVSPQGKSDRIVARSNTILGGDTIIGGNTIVGGDIVVGGGNT